VVPQEQVVLRVLAVLQVLVELQEHLVQVDKMVFQVVSITT